MSVRVIEQAVESDAEQLAMLHELVAAELTRRYGLGHWSRAARARGVARAVKTACVLLAREEGRIIATLTLAKKKPWSIDKSYFTPCERPLYLTNMAVHPDVQRRGIGRWSLDVAMDVARDWPASAVRLDAYDADAGAGGFYTRCGFREVGRAVYRGTPLIYFEKLVQEWTNAKQ